MKHDDLPPVRFTDGPVVTITMCRPHKLNALDEDLYAGLLTALDTVAHSATARVVILTGEGEAFCAGGDLAMIQELQHDVGARARVMDTARQMFQRLASFPMPIIAAVNGPAIGGGCTLALLCDIVVMSEDAVLGDPHVRVGLVPGDGGAVIWPLLAGLGAARGFLLTGDLATSAEAHRLGLVWKVVPSADLYSQALGIAERLGQLPQFALRETKRALNLYLMHAANVFEFAATAEDRSFDDDDHRLLVAGLLDRRRGQGSQA